MSRSLKKPFHGIACCKAKHLKTAKLEMSRITRKEIDKVTEIPSGSYYKKFLHSWRWRPDDGKTFNPKWSKAYRK